MAIPRYKREKLDARVATEQLGGAADAAAAKGYGDIAREQQGVAAVQSQRTNQELQSFGQRLNTFVNQASSMMQSDAAIKGRKQGIIDTSDRRKQILDIRVKYNGDEAKIDEETAKVTAATAEDNFSTFGRVYQDSVNGAYANQTEVDAANTALMAKNDANGNPETFKELYKKYEEMMVKGAPNELGTIATRKAFEKYGVRTYEGMYNNDAAAKTTQADKNVKANITGLQGLIKDAASRGDVAAVAAYQGQLGALVNARVTGGKMGVAEGRWNVKESQTIAQTAEFMRHGNAAANMGTGWDFIRKIQDPGHPFGKAFDRMPAEVQSKILSEMKTATRAYQDGELGKEKFDSEKVDVQQGTNTRTTKEHIMNNGMKLTLDQLHTMEGTGRISASQIKEIIDFQEQQTDAASFSYMNDGSVLVDMSAEQIMEMPDISFEDKNKLMSKRESALKDPLYDWTRSRVGKEALTRLKEDYDIPVGMDVASMMASFNSEKSPMNKEFIEFRRKLFDQVQGLKFSDQPEGAMKIYNTLRAEYNVVKDEKDTTKENNTNKRLYDSYTALAATESDGWFADEVTAKQLMQRQVDTDPKFTQKKMDRILEAGGYVEPKPTKPKKKTTTKVSSMEFHDYSKTRAYAAKAKEFGIGRTGGSRSWRNRNPGNIEAGDFATGAGATGSDGRFAIFPTEMAGRNAQIKLLQSKNYKNLDIKQAIARYAPAFENNVDAYIAATGVKDPSKKMGSYTSREMSNLVDAMKKHEGWKVGRG